CDSLTMSGGTMQCSHCGAEIPSHLKPGSTHGERGGVARLSRRLINRILLAVFSSGWVVMAAISEFWHIQYISTLHRTGFSQQTPEFFLRLDIDYRFQSAFYFMCSCLWLTLVLFVWAWKLSAHLERTRLIARPTTGAYPRAIADSPPDVGLGDIDLS
ncbi:MAG: hypothetical protein J0I40_06680, partial [Cellulomonas sp.]|nr:hypothetical protein [Cellulomonas sp.]